MDNNTNIGCVASSHSVSSTESSGGFVGSLILKLSGMTNSTLSVTGNSSLNGIVVECHDAGIFSADIRNIAVIALSFTDATTHMQHLLIFTFM